MSMDPLMAAASHNLTCSRLCQLPEKILIGIMKLLDPLDMQCLRRACRLFLRLYCDASFADSHDVQGFWHWMSGYQHWLSPDTSYWPKKSGPTLISRLERDVQHLCGSCRSMRAKSDWPSRVKELDTESLYCWGCKKHHPSVLFSPYERKKKDDRICIGRQGHIRLCDHKVVTWDMVSKAAAQLIKVDAKFRARIPLSRYEHPEHHSKHHKEAMKVQCPNVSPYVEIYGVEGHDLVLSLNWQGHMVVEGDAPIKPAVLCKQLEEFRKGVAEFIAPKLPPGRLPEMSCFDPNRCDCLYFEGMEQLPDWPRPLPDALKMDSCRAQPESRLTALRNAAEDPESWAGGHKATMQFIANSGYGVSELQVSVEPCMTGENRCLAIRYRRLIGLCYGRDGQHKWLDQVTPAWCQALEPKSYELTTQDNVFYVNALGALHKDLYNTKSHICDATLLACQAINLYQFTGHNHTMAEWTSHAKGLAQILQLRGPAAHTSGVGHAIFESCRINLIIASLCQQEDTFLAQDSWKSLSLSIETNNQFDRIVDILVGLPNLVARAKDLGSWADSAKKDNARSALFEQCVNLMRELKACKDPQSYLLYGGGRLMLL
ncbi:unnamed protein product [Clonostachys byssicola]|uniref:F-box domain-containing protein n=1 Tax=Clonostachys byssicola TaxID=160290 RepID=A0A9N9U6C3_9HYPO|nr:unnamed protein product [Clonostachys byssicola]